jgi:hypothetical protein
MAVKIPVRGVQPTKQTIQRRQAKLLDLTARDLSEIVDHLSRLCPNPTRVRESIALKLAEDALARIKAETT